MKVLLLGGTGAMGSHLTNILSEQGNQVVVTSRSRNGTKNSVEYWQGNAKEIEFLKEVLTQNWDAIVDFMIYSEIEFSERKDLLLNAAAQYIFLSSARVYDNSPNELLENSNRLLDSSSDQEYLATSEYALSKARQENILRASVKKNWTIVRPYITYSEKRLQLGTLEKENWLYRALKGRTIVFSQDVNDRITTLTYGLDVANSIARLINKPSACGEVYHITSNCAFKWSDIIEVYLNVLEDHLGYRPKVLYQNLADFLAWNPGKYQIIYDRLFNRYFDNTKINEFVNTKDFVDVHEGLKKCLLEFLENPEFLRISWKSEAKKDRIANEKTPLSEIVGIKEKIKYLIFRYLI